MNKRLERPLDQAQLGGVCAGLAEYFGLDRTLIRVIFVLGIFLPHFPALLIYVILWIAMPERRFGTVPGAGEVQPKLFANPAFSMNPNNPNNTDTQRSNTIWGIVLVVLGVLFLLDRWFDIDFGDLWPLILIAVGVWLVFRDRIGKDVLDDPFKRSEPYQGSYPRTDVPPTSSTTYGTTTSGSAPTPSTTFPTDPTAPRTDPDNPASPTDPTTPKNPL